MKKILSTLLISIFILSSSLSAQNLNKSEAPKLFNKTDAYLEKMIDSLGIVGVNYAVLIDNKLVHQKSFGLANLQMLSPMKSDYSFPVASISKLFSSIALHQLLKENNRSFEETIGELLPERIDLPKSWRNLTLKQILSHTSGIPDQIDYQIYLAPESEKFVIENMKDKPFSSKPGSESKYNATGFLLVRIVIEKLAEQDFESYMKVNFFDKYDLGSAQYGGFKKVIEDRVTCYQTVNNELQMFPLNYSSPMYAGAGLNININDLTKWFQILQDGKILDKVDLEKIWTPVELNNGEYGSFGLGWEAYKLQSGFRIAGHGGAGISSFRHYWNEKTNENVTVILLTNGAKNWIVRPNRINASVASMILDK